MASISPRASWSLWARRLSAAHWPPECAREQSFPLQTRRPAHFNPARRPDELRAATHAREPLRTILKRRRASRPMDLTDNPMASKMRCHHRPPPLSSQSAEGKRAPERLRTPRTTGTCLAASDSEAASCSVEASEMIASTRLATKTGANARTRPAGRRFRRQGE